MTEQLQELQNLVSWRFSSSIPGWDPEICPACWQPQTKVYCTPVPDIEVRLRLRANGLGAYAGPCHRIDVPLN
jgi:hypothetical protein